MLRSMRFKSMGTNCLPVAGFQWPVEAPPIESLGIVHARSRLGA
jgi:hypothetical protein